MSRHRYERNPIEDEDAVAARAVEAWWEITGDDELAQAAREALVAVAEEAQARKKRRVARERKAARRGEAQAQAARERAARERRREAAERDARLAAVERNQRRRRAVERRLPMAAPVAPAWSGYAHAERTPPRETDAGASPLRAAMMAAIDGHGEAERDDQLGESFEAGVSGNQEAREPNAPTTTAPAARPLTGFDLAAWRARLGLTQQAAADRLGVTQGTISKGEGRRNTALGSALQAALAAALAA